MLVSNGISIRLQKCLLFQMRHVEEGQIVEPSLKFQARKFRPYSRLFFLAHLLPSFLRNAESVKWFVLC